MRGGEDFYFWLSRGDDNFCGGVKEEGVDGTVGAITVNVVDDWEGADCVRGWEGVGKGLRHLCRGGCVVVFVEGRIYGDGPAAC